MAPLNLLNLKISKLEEVKIFISYASKDDHYYRLFKEGIENQAKHSKRIKWSLWSDKEIQPGQIWHEVIQNEIQNCNCAILLVSANFLSSSYIENNEFLKFVERSERDGFIFFPVLISDCDIQQWNELAKRQFFFPKGKDYGHPDLEHITYSHLVDFFSQHAAKPNPFRETFHKKCVEGFENALLSQRSLDKPLATGGLQLQKGQRQHVNLAIDILKNKSKDLDPDSTAKDLQDVVKLGNSIVGEVLGNVGKIVSRIIDSEHLKKLYAQVQFDEIAFSDSLDFVTEKMIMEKMRYATKYPWYERSLIVSALSLSLIRKFDADKINLLLDFIRGKEKHVWKRALVGLVLGLNNKINYIDQFLKDILQQLKQDVEIQQVLLELHTVLKDGFAEETLSKYYDATAFFMHFDFFDKPQHWFMPFYSQNPYLHDKVKEVRLHQLLTDTPALEIDAIKYSFCLNYENYTDKQIQRMIEVLEEEKAMVAKLFSHVQGDVIACYKGLFEIKSYCSEFYFFNLNYPAEQWVKTAAGFDFQFTPDLNSLVFNELAKLKIDGDDFFAKRNFAEAKKKYEEFLAYLPENETVLTKIGLCFQQEKNYTEAIKYHRRAFEINPNYEWNLGSMGFCYCQLKEYNNAEKYLSLAVSFEPEQTFNLYWLALACYENGNFEKAIYCHRQYKRIKPNSSDNLFRLGWNLFVNGEISNSLTEFLESLQYEVNAMAYMNIAHCYLILGNESEALKNYLISYSKFEDKKTFFDGCEEDFLYIGKHNIEKAHYDQLIDQVRKQG